MAKRDIHDLFYSLVCSNKMFIAEITGYIVHLFFIKILHVSFSFCSVCDSSDSTLNYEGLNKIYVLMK